MLNDLARAQLAGFYNTLAADEDATISLAVLKHYIGERAVAEIKSMKADLAAAKKDKNYSLDLSNGAVEYWKRFKALRRQADVVSAGPNSSKREAESGRKAETLRDDFYKLVPKREHGKFIIHDPTANEADWDFRWDYLEHRPPLLREDLAGQFPVEKPMNFAQMQVLGRFIEPPRSKQEVQEEEAKAATLRETLLRHVDPDNRPIRIVTKGDKK